MHLPQELRARANAFRTEATHLFMLGQKVRLKGDFSAAGAMLIFDSKFGAVFKFIAVSNR